jgi:hypothetical protein
MHSSTNFDGVDETQSRAAILYSEKRELNICCRPEAAMKRVIIVPITETDRFPGMEIFARGNWVAALVGDTVEARTRSAFDSDDAFFFAVGYGHADHYTFHTLEEAVSYAKDKIEVLTTLELTVLTEIQNSAGIRRLTPIIVQNCEQDRKRA